MIIGLGHLSRVGKDTLALQLYTHFRQQFPDQQVLIIPFARKLKSICHILFEPYGLENEQYYDDHPKERLISLPIINMTPLEIWVKFGTETMRKQYDEYIWCEHLDLAIKYCNPDILIIPDVRFPNEVSWLKAHPDVVLIKVNRLGFNGYDTIADNAMREYDEWDDVVTNKEGDANLMLPQALKILERKFGCQKVWYT